MAGVSVEEHAKEYREKESLFTRIASSYLQGKNLFYTIVFVCIGFLVFYPVILLFINSFKVGPSGTTVWGLGNWHAALTEPALVSSLVNTISLTVVGQTLAIVVGLVLAWLFARTDLPGRNWLEFGFWCAFFMPTLPMTQAWILMLDPDRGFINKFFGGIPFLNGIHFDIFSWWGIVWVHLVTTSIAIKILMLTPAFRNLDSSMEEASRVSGASYLRTFAKIIIPVLAPTILIVLIIGIIHSMEAFEVELILGGPIGLDVFSTKIYRMIIQTAEPQYGSATALGSVVLILMLPLILIQQRVSQRGGYATVSGKFKVQLFKLGKWKWPIFAVVFLMITGMTIFALVALLMGTFMQLFGFFNIPNPWTLENWKTVLGREDFITGLSTTLILSISVAIISMLLYSVVAYIIVRSKFVARGLLDFTVWLPSTLPGIVVSLGMLWLFLTFPLFKPLYGTIIVLILAIVLTAITTGTQVLKSNLVQLGGELEEASWIHGGSWWYTYRRIVLPLIAPAMGVVGIFGFAIATRSTSTVSLLATSDLRPLSLLQLNYMSDGSYETASVIGVVVMVLTVGVALLARIFGLKVGIGKDG